MPEFGFFSNPSPQHTVSDMGPSTFVVYYIFVFIFYFYYNFVILLYRIATFIIGLFYSNDLQSIID